MTFSDAKDIGDIWTGSTQTVVLYASGVGKLATFDKYSLHEASAWMLPPMVVLCVAAAAHSLALPCSRPLRGWALSAAWPTVQPSKVWNWTILQYMIAINQKLYKIDAWFLLSRIGSQVCSIKWWQCWWPWVTANHPNHHNLYIYCCISCCRNGWW